VQDTKGNEAVVFTDTDGKTLGAARSGVPEIPSEEKQYEVLSLIGAQKYIDIHIPKGCEGIASLLGSASNYKIFDLKTEQANGDLAKAGFYRIEYTGSTVLTKNHTLCYIDKTTKKIQPVQSDAVGVRYKVNYYDFSLNEYDKVGQLKTSLQPIGFNKNSLTGLTALVAHNPALKSTFVYNSLGQLLTATSPDEGTTNFMYRKDGQIRFSQNSKQVANNNYSYTNYDEFGRPVESGVSSGTFTTLNGDTSSVTGTKEQQFTEYDFLSSNSKYILQTNTHSNYYTPSFLAGNVATTWNTDEMGNKITQTFYSYDIYGRVQWIVQNIAGLGVKTIDYEYDPVTSQVLKVIYQKNNDAERFVHRYSYNIAQELVQVETSTDNSNFSTHAAYTYYETGALKRINLADGIQGIDYVYNLAGQLKAINHPDLNTESLREPGEQAGEDLFGMTLDYYTGDYQRKTNFSFANIGVDQYNGNIKAITWKTNNQLGANNPLQYGYQYNQNNWLKEALFNANVQAQVDIPADTPADIVLRSIITTPTDVEATNSIILEPGFEAAWFSANITSLIHPSDELGTEEYKVSGITYDANGNIQRLNRNKNTENGSNHMDQLSYVYKTDKPNQLDRVLDAVTAPTNADDIKTQNTENYVYNSIGQLTRNRQEGTVYTYNASGLVTEILKGKEPLVRFVYNDKGFRVKKIVSPLGNSTLYPATTYYIRDAAGTVMAIIEPEIGKTSQGPKISYPIYGASRLGIYNKTNNSSVYQLTDHLGNVRAVISKQGTNAVALVSATDYYPGGMVMPGRMIRNGQAYRYNYQGQELDPETGKVAFELRLYDPRINRWMTTDPAKQYASPYMSMGNNWVNQVDPDGAFSPPTDYYDKDSGAYLGNINDGIDQVAFVDSGVYGTLSSLWTGGHESAYWGHLSDYSQIIRMSHANFKDIAGTLFAEGSTQMSIAEATGIYSVMENRAAADGKTVLGVASGGGIYGWGHRDKINSIYANKAQVNNAYLGLRNGYFNADTSGGAYFWHGADFGKKNWQAYKSYYLSGFKFTDTAHDLWNLGTHKSKHSWLYKYESTGASGGTTFMRLTTAWQSANGSTRWNGQ
jgi:RHS repeat-associated protein